MAKLKRKHEDVEEFDEELEDEETEERDSPFSNPFIKWGLIGGTILVIIIGGVLFKSMSSQKQTDTQPKTEHVEEKKEETKKVEVPKESNTDDKVKPKGVDEKSAKESLERPDAPLSAEETDKIGKSISSSLTKLKESGQGAQNNMDIGLTLTESGVFNLVHSLLDVGYTVDTSSVKGYKSDTSNVEQFTFNLTKDGAKPITITGNWVPSISQLGLVQIHGEIPSMGSPTNSKQSDPNVKNPEDNPK